MANTGVEQNLPGGNNESTLSSLELDTFVALLPELSYSVNRMLEDCTPQFSKKVGVALWALGGATKTDEVGTFLTNADLVSPFRDWFVVSESSANPEVSKVKRELFKRHFIKIEGDPGHIHLTDAGKDAVRTMQARAKVIVQQTLGVLKRAERSTLSDFAKRMIATKRKPMMREGSSDQPPKEALADTARLF